MQFFMFATVVAASVAVAIAAPPSAGGADGAGAPSVNSAVCSNTAVCCTTDLSGVVDLDCSPPTPPPRTIPEFIKTCDVRNQHARCCALVVAGQGILCNAPA